MADAAIIADFATRFPAFNAQTRDTFLPVVCEIYKNYYCFEYTDDTKEAILQLLAHLITVESSTSTQPGLIKTGQSAGSVSVSFAEGQVSKLAQFYNTSKYGQQFWQIISQSGGGACFV